MGRTKRDDKIFEINWEEFQNGDEDMEDEIYDLYETLTIDAPDFHLSRLNEFFEALSIPSALTCDIKECVDYFYEIDLNKVESNYFNEGSAKRETLKRFIRDFTITPPYESLQTNDIMDIVDFDKLIKQSKLLFGFRNNYQNILQSWSILIESSNAKSDINADIESMLIGLPELRAARNSVESEDSREQEIGDSVLIDMLGIFSGGEKISYSLSQLNQPLVIGIKDFAQILAYLGDIV